MKKRIILNPNMGADIVTHLSQFGQLPDRGIVAGQAVASAIQDLYGSGAGVYNDVDVFRLVGTQVLRREDTAAATASLTHLATPGEERRYTALEEYLEMMRTYRVSSVTREDMLNYVNCALPLSFGRYLTAGRVIESFDLNCVRVAVDLSTKRLVWDRHFEKFVNSRQLEIVAVHTPWHTFLRLLKKLEELPGVYADIEASAEVACAISQSDFYQRFVYSGAISRAFGERARTTAEQFQSGWSPYFSMQQFSSDVAGVELYALEPRADVAPQLLEQVNALHCSALHYTAQVVYGSRLAKSTKLQIRRQEFETSLAEERNPKNNPLFGYLEVHGDRYLEGQTSFRHRQTVRNFLHDHRLRDVLVDLTLDQQYQLIGRLKTLEQEFGLWVYGVLEDEATATDLNSLDELRGMMQRYLVSAVIPIEVPPLVLPTLPAPWRKRGVIVEELLRPLDMMEEGVAMGHCVGGYAGKVRSNYSRLLRIRTSNKSSGWSTVEVQAEQTGRIKRNSKLVSVQHRGRFNGPAPEFNEEVLDFVLLLQGRSKAYMYLRNAGLLHRAARMEVQLLPYAARACRALARFVGKVVKKARSLEADLHHMARTADRRGDELVTRFNVEVKPEPNRTPEEARRARAFAGFAEMDDDCPF